MTLRDGGTLIQRVLSGDQVSGDDEDVGVAALGKVFVDFVQGSESLESSRYRSEENSEILGLTASLLRGMQITLPPNVFSKNTTILPTRMEQLFGIFKAEEDLGGVRTDSSEPARS